MHFNTRFWESYLLPTLVVPTCLMITFYQLIKKKTTCSQNLTNTCNASTQVDITVPKVSARIQVNPKMRTRGLLLIDVLCISLLLKVFM